MSKNRFFFPLIAALISLSLGILIMAAAQITPFGNNNLLISDMGSQYIAFFSSLHHTLLTNSFQFYSFSQSLGANFFPTIAYYLISPFNFLFLLFPNAAVISKIVTIIIILKITAAAFSMTYFLERHFKQQQIMLAILGSIYSFCGFVALNYFNIMWLDTLIWLPLVINGLELLVSTGRTRNFFSWLFISILTNFYLGYMTCLFACFYFIYTLLEKSKPQQHFWHGNFSIIIKFLISEFLCALSAAFLLLPTALGMLQTAKGGSLKDFTLAPQFGLEFLSQLGVGASDYMSRLAHAPSIFSTTFVTLLTLCFFVHPQIKNSSKKNAAVLLIILLLSMLFRVSNSIWHLGQQPAGFPFRNSFFISFMLIIFAYQAWEKGLLDLDRRWKQLLPMLLASAIVLGYLGSYLTPWFLRHYFAQSFKGEELLPQSTSLTSVILSLIFILLTSFLIFWPKIIWRKSLLTSIIGFEIICNFLLAMQGTPFGNQTIYQKNFNLEAAQIKQLTQSSNELFRVNNSNSLINKAYRENYYNYNDPLLFNFYGIDFYSSTLNEATRKTLHSLGLFSKNVRRISSLGLTPVTELLFGIKYSLTFADKQPLIRTNNSFAGSGFIVSPAFATLQLKMQHKSSAIINQEKILQALKRSNEPYFKEVQIQTVKKAAIAPSSNSYKYTYIIKNSAAGPVYLDNAIGHNNYVTMRVNGRKLPFSSETKRHKYLRYIGNFPRQKKIQISFSTKKPNAKKYMHFYNLDQAKFQEVVNQARHQNFTPQISTSLGQTKISGSIKVTSQHSQMLYLAVPYDKGWQVQRNNKTITPQRALGSMMILKLKPGDNHLILSYHVPGLKLGLLISLSSFFLYVLLEFYWSSKPCHQYYPKKALFKD
ncbi:YfhO family protein [Liquorilactobacillus capillatus]|uniref:Integral membrane protein n=1 Tax=Liquorilactobacillus capillatus DSM 19910 TaxID=1423731 RepID=A0A0R1M0G5_9LACO|nr:YfhO family protein [Liquorilactobacillus capillatus]KRL01089.1 integral membrane protein [Liquorilactobacillus capillatus DSM 19910]